MTHMVNTLSDTEAQDARELLAAWAEARADQSSPTQPDLAPMETRCAHRPWQDIAEMDTGLAAELAGIAAGFSLLALWHVHAATRTDGNGQRVASRVQVKARMQRALYFSDAVRATEKAAAQEASGC